MNVTSGLDSPQRSRMFTCQRDGEAARPDMRGHKTFDCIDRLLIDLSVEIQRRDRGNPSPFTKRLAAERLVLELDLMRGLNDRERTLTGSRYVARYVFVGGWEDADARLVGMTPRFFEA